MDHNKSKVTLLGEKSRTIDHVTGLLQGSILSPILYTAHLDELAKRLARKTAPQRICTFLYADDIAIIADSAEEMAELLEICQQYSQHARFIFQPTKCEILAGQDVDTSQCQLYGQCLQRSTSFLYLGMTMGVGGIEAQAHVMRLCNKTIKTINMLKRTGFNGRGFSTKVKRKIYPTFIRPRFEYGLQVIKPTQKILRLLASTQHYALCTMFGVGNTTGRRAVEGLAEVESMHDRCQRLNASWVLRTEGLGKNFLIHDGRKAAERRLYSKSAFAIERKNPLLARYRDLTIWKGLSRLTTKQRKDMLRKIHQEKDKDSSTRHMARKIESIQSQSIRRLMTLWILRRLIGKPETCKACMLNRATYEHVQHCLNKPVDELIKQGKWRQAAKAVVAISAQCLGRSIARFQKISRKNGEISTTRTVQAIIDRKI